MWNVIIQTAKSASLGIMKPRLYSWFYVLIVLWFLSVKLKTTQLWILICKNKGIVIEKLEAMLHCCSVYKSCPTLWDPMTCRMPCFPVLWYLSESAQIHVNWLSDAIQPSDPLLPPSPPAFSLSQHQDIFHWVNSLHQVPKYWSFSFIISLSN